MIGIPINDAFGIDENSFKTRDERRLEDIARKRDEQVEVQEQIQTVHRKEEVQDAKEVRQALRSVGADHEAVAPTVDAAAPSGEASGLKGQELRP
ncbi:MAG: hypothetical protein AAFU79_32650 [Myxococcota bacterium]